MAKKKTLMESTEGMLGKPKQPIIGATAVAVGARGGSPARKGETYSVTTVRLRSDQWAALREAAMRRAMTATGGDNDPKRADASAIIRELVDQWVEQGSK